MKYKLLLLIIPLVLLGIFFTWPKYHHKPIDSSAHQVLDISGITIPHHDLVKPQREAFLAKVAKSMAQPKTIILISPNHYEVGIGSIQTSRQTWHVNEGDIKPNTDVIDALKGNATEEPGSFINEHGIKLVLGDLKHYFPKATIVPIIMKRNVTMVQINTLNKVLYDKCADCLMVDSVDFSHYQPALLANLHDDLALRALQNIDGASLLKNSEVDSPAALALLAKWADLHHTEEFHLDNHTNSGILSNSPDEESTSHVFGWYQTGKVVTPSDSVSFIIGGDMMFGRSIAHTFLANGLQTSLDQLGERVFWGTDAGIVNLEGPVSDQPVLDDTRPNNLTFNFPPETIQALKFIKINAASQANNHSGNAGQLGLATTRSLLKAADIQPIGGPNDGDVNLTASFTGQRLKLYVIGVLELTSQPDLTGLIQTLKKDPNNRVMIFPHWGAEYLQGHTDLQTQQAHAWIDAGADVVIGSHPHVIEDAELYKGHPIIYSLGNLLFDQTFSSATQQGLLIAGKFEDDGLCLFGLPTQSKNYKPALMTGSGKTAILDQLYKPFKNNTQTTSAGSILYFPTQSK